MTQGVTLPQGFTAAATTAGIKPSGKPDMALVVNNGPKYVAAGVFTRNRVYAAPVKWSRAAVADGQLKAVIYNSGNANACNGLQGEQDCETVVAAVAAELGVAKTEVGACSTGIIGELLPTDKLIAGAKTLAADLNTEAGLAAAKAIMTTDTVHKIAAYHGKGWSIGAMGKGVGMMAPSLATMLVCLTTDADVTAQQAQAALKAATKLSFDCVDIDGSTSTNDTVFLLANGASGIVPDEAEFAAAVREVCVDLARQMQADAEGVTKRVTITVQGAQSDDEALNAARTVGRDNLFKCAMFGSDPNWGRVLAAVGMADAQMDAEHISVFFNNQPVCLDSTGAPGARDVDLSGEDILVTIDLGTGGAGTATVFTTDLSHSYVEINSAYST